MKRIFARGIALLLSLMLLLSLCACGGSEDSDGEDGNRMKKAAAPKQGNAVAGGLCGSEVTWLLDDNGVLFILGNGPMTDWKDSKGRVSTDNDGGTADSGRDFPAGQRSRAEDRGEGHLLQGLAVRGTLRMVCTGR